MSLAVLLRASTFGNNLARKTSILGRNKFPGTKPFEKSFGKLICWRGSRAQLGKIVLADLINQRVFQYPANASCIRASTLPRSARGKACDYALGRWDQLRRFLDYGQLELSNNLAENAIRPIAVGRKNWLHVGSERAGPRVAAILSVVQTCRRHQIPIREYLGSVLPGLAESP
jgi:hypothetical protein